MGSFNPRISGAEKTSNAANTGALNCATVTARLFFATLYNGTAATVYLMVFDSATTPANGSTPLMTVQVPAGSTEGLDWWTGRPFGTGITVAASTTGITLTLAAGGALTGLQLDAGYRIS